MKNNKNLIFIIPDLEIGGTQRILIFLANFLVNKGFKITIFVFKKPNKRIFDISPEIKLHTLNISKESKNIFEKISYNLYRIKKIRLEIKKFNSYKIISFLTTTNILTLISSIGLGKKIIINERNDPTKQKIHYFWKFMRFLIYNRADRIIVNIPNIRKYNLFYKILFFIQTTITLFLTKKKIKREKVILTVARLNYQKNLDLLIKSFSKSLAVKKNWKLVILGKGKEKKKLKKLIENLNISKSVIFKGVVEKIDIWYKKAGIFILSSRFEGMPNALIEAMYYKTAVIGANIPGIRYFIKNNVNGFLFSKNDENSLTKLLNLLIGNSKLRQSLGFNAHKDINYLANPDIFFNTWLRHLK